MIVNTTSLTLGSARQSRTTIRAQAGQLRERLARRAGIALLAWSRRQEERRSTDAATLRRQTEQSAARARDDQYRRITLAGAGLI